MSSRKQNWIRTRGGFLSLHWGNTEMAERRQSQRPREWPLGKPRPLWLTRAYSTGGLWPLLSEGLGHHSPLAPAPAQPGARVGCDVILGGCQTALS